MGKEVIIPAVMPCRKCMLCKTGRGNRCLAQKMPGNSLGIYGGFSSHIPVPSIDLCEVRDRGDIPLEFLAVVADAVTTPYQAVRRADLRPGDSVIVIGVTGGVGVYTAQMAKAFGAKTVISFELPAAWVSWNNAWTLWIRLMRSYPENGIDRTAWMPCSGSGWIGF